MSEDKEIVIKKLFTFAIENQKKVTLKLLKITMRKY